MDGDGFEPRTAIWTQGFLEGLFDGDIMPQLRDVVRDLSRKHGAKQSHGRSVVTLLQYGRYL